MGNSIDSSMSDDRPIAVVTPLSSDSSDEENTVIEEDTTKANVTLQLFNYRQQLSLKKQHVVKWATSKLVLTEEMLKHQQQQQREEERQQREKQRKEEPEYTFDVFDESDAAWAERQLALLSNETLTDDLENEEPVNDPYLSELTQVMKYRMQLRDTLLNVAQEKFKKRNKKQIKRLKRRTLISSKKPSNKDKHRDRVYSNEDED